MHVAYVIGNVFGREHPIRGLGHTLIIRVGEELVTVFLTFGFHDHGLQCDPGIRKWVDAVAHHLPEGLEGEFAALIRIGHGVVQQVQDRVRLDGVGQLENARIDGLAEQFVPQELVVPARSCRDELVREQVLS